EVRPRKHGEEMTAVRVIPRRTKGGEHRAARLEHPRHHRENPGGIFVMLERIERDDDVGSRVAGRPFLGDDAPAGEAGRRDALGGTRNPFRPRLEADDLAGTAFGELDYFMAFAATEIDDGLASDVVPN